MSNSVIHSIGIIDFRNIVAVVKDAYDIDLSNFAFTSIRRRLEKIIKLNNLHGITDLINKIEKEPDFHNTFISQLAVPETEMFRDPAMWSALRDKVLTKIADYNFKIWLPEVTTGEELFTLQILLKETNCFEKAQIIATLPNQNMIDDIKKGTFSLKKMEVNNANYKRYEGKSKLSDYYHINGNDAFMDLDLLKNVTYNAQDILSADVPKKIKLVIYRNKMIYFNKRMQNEVTNRIHTSLLPGGFFIIGVKESLECCNSDRKFQLLDDKESIFKRTIA